jgi:hypothetical protein
MDVNDYKRLSNITSRHQESVFIAVLPFTVTVGSSTMSICDKVCQVFMMGLWFSLVSSTNKTDHHDITEILLKVELNSIILTHKIDNNNQILDTMQRTRRFVFKGQFYFLAILFRPFGFIAPKTLNYLVLQPFDFERI